MKKIEMTLAYFIRNNMILLPLKKKKIGKGKNNGVGGHVELGETHEQAMIRECVEEVGLTPLEYEYLAEVNFNGVVIDSEKYLVVVYVYKCSVWSGDLIETEEMKPHWFNINDIPYDNMIDNDKYWLPLILEGKRFKANFDIDENFMTVKYNIVELNQIV